MHVATAARQINREEEQIARISEWKHHGWVDYSGLTTRSRASSSQGPMEGSWDVAGGGGAQARAVPNRYVHFKPPPQAAAKARPGPRTMAQRIAANAPPAGFADRESMQREREYGGPIAREQVRRQTDDDRDRHRRPHQKRQ